MKMTRSTIHRNISPSYRTFASRASGKSSSQKLVTARLMYLIRACGTAHLEGARETRWCEKRETLVATWMLFKAVAGVDTENRILTYYDEPASGPGLVAAPSARSNSAPGIASLSTPARSRPGDSTTRCDCWYRPPCRCPSLVYRTPPILIWTISTSAAPSLVPLYTAPYRTATCKSYLRSLV